MLKPVAQSPHLQTSQALHLSQPDSFPCRGQQLDTLTSFLTSHLRDHTPGSLYVSGCTGTGKSACVAHALGRVTDLGGRVVELNCMSLSSARLIYAKLAEELGVKVKELESLLTTSEQMM